MSLYTHSKTNPMFIRHRPTVLDELSLDIIKSHIYPLLDYESKVNLNKCLPIWDRISTRMTSEFIQKHDRKVRSIHIYSILLSLEERGREDWRSYNIHGDSRIRRIINMFNLFKLQPYLNLCENSQSIRTVILRKLSEFENMNFSEFEHIYSKEDIYELMSTCKYVKALLSL